jgi:formylmethanofuran dehydrogenase subunit E
MNPLTNCTRCGKSTTSGIWQERCHCHLNSPNPIPIREEWVKYAEELTRLLKIPEELEAKEKQLLERIVELKKDLVSAEEDLAALQPIKRELEKDEGMGNRYICSRCGRAYPCMGSLAVSRPCVCGNVAYYR